MELTVFQQMELYYLIMIYKIIIEHKQAFFKNKGKFYIFKKVYKVSLNNF